jgi:hypothetical protein
MMSQRFCLFDAGYSAYFPALHFNKMSVVTNFSEHSEESVKSYAGGLITELEKEAGESRSRLEKACELAKVFDLSPGDLPSGYVTYFPWLAGFTDLFETQFPMSRIDHYYFLYGRKLAEIQTNIGLTQWYIKLFLNSKKLLDLTSGIEKCLKDTEYILFKLVACAALLSSEPRHGFFNVNYKKLNESYAPFREITFRELNDEQIEETQGKLAWYYEQVSSGLQHCVSSLQELQV